MDSQLIDMLYQQNPWLNINHNYNGCEIQFIPLGDLPILFDYL